MPTATYTPLATVTLASTASSVTFSNIPATYRDLIVVANFTPSGAMGNIVLRVNGDGGNNYPLVYANGTGTGTDTRSLTTNGFFGTYTLATTRNTIIWNVMDYSATDKHKTALSRCSNASESSTMTAARWTNTAAITSLTVAPDSSTFAVGGTFNLYGIVA